MCTRCNWPTSWFSTEKTGNGIVASVPAVQEQKRLRNEFNSSEFATSVVPDLPVIAQRTLQAAMQCHKRDSGYALLCTLQASRRSTTRPPLAPPIKIRQLLAVLWTGSPSPEASPIPGCQPRRIPGSMYSYLQATSPAGTDDVPPCEPDALAWDYGT
ncbi:hypothetical protein TWF694_008542 [Orbilia ellipsospora]|uniref:Uncharacterized protein n=1 Tax=Orbilia ellipsospora TaxID=2528407 RepID=A0AAV9XGH1_9PEZI